MPNKGIVPETDKPTNGVATDPETCLFLYMHGSCIKYINPDFSIRLGFAIIAFNKYRDEGDT